ncbi:MAG: transposase [Phycisphaerae bacterium]|nr:transposase [Phycisphaerae bacterium]
MSEYRRLDAPGATVFFTIDAIVIMPDHIHAIWTMPPGDDRFGLRWSAIKAAFMRAYLAGGGHETRRSASRRARNERGVWQRRFWDHVIRDDDDLGRHVDYIYYNPVKHGCVNCPHAWPYTSFHRHVRDGLYTKDWMCVRGGRSVRPLDLRSLEGRVGE